MEFTKPEVRDLRARIAKSLSQKCEPGDITELQTSPSSAKVQISETSLVYLVEKPSQKSGIYEGVSVMGMTNEIEEVQGATRIVHSLTHGFGVVIGSVEEALGVLAGFLPNTH
jgi:hypothetical protein